MTSLTNAGKIAEAADEFGKYIYGTETDPQTGKRVKAVQKGLVIRRAAERKLFLGE
jgi:GH24 family phage-related lysozyme (muramidase)